ncbi:hypothetical protein LXL04_005833 [Taraxacum kok-saghyz]
MWRREDGRQRRRWRPVRPHGLHTPGPPLARVVVLVRRLLKLLINSSKHSQFAPWKETRKLGAKMDEERQTEGEQKLGSSKFKRVYTRMCPVNKKLQIIRCYKPTKLDESVSQALVQLENENEDLGSELKDLYFNYVNEIPLSADCKALVIFYPHKLRPHFHKIHLKLVPELEKMFSQYVVFLIARLTISGRSKIAVQDVFLEDLVYPAKILLTKIPLDDSPRRMMIYLNPEAENDTKDKLPAFKTVFTSYTKKNIFFEYIEKLQASDLG